MVVLSLGANLGNKIENINRMSNKLFPYLTNVIESPLYKTEPIGVVGHSFYVNKIIAGEYNGDVYSLLEVTQKIERELGRHSKGDLSPRTADIDILLFNNEVIQEKTLVIPHHALFERKFEIMGVKSVVPNMKIPGEDILFSSYTLDVEVDKQIVEIIGEEYGSDT